MAIFNLKSKQKAPAKDLTKEVGVAGEVVFEGFDNEEARSDIVSIKQYRKMIDKDPTIESLFNIFTLPIIAATYRIDADKDDIDEEQANFVRKNLFEPPHKGGMESPFTLFHDQAMQAAVDGFQLWEKVYKLENGRFVLRKLAHRDSVGITLIRDKDGGYGGARQLVSYGNRQVDEILPAYKTLLFTHNKARNYLYGRSALTSLRSPYEKKRRLEYLDSVALQADAIKPKVLLRTSESTMDGDQSKKGGSLVNKALDALSKLGERKAVASVPYGYDVKEMTQNGRDPHQSIERQNSEMARAFMATFSLMSSQGKSDVGSYALSDNLKDMLMISLKAFMTKFEEHINQYVIADLINLNFATPRYPEFHYDDITSDTVEIVAQAFIKLIEKDKISDEMVQGIEQQTASRLEIDLEQLKRDRADREEREEEEETQPNGDRELSDIAARDFPGLHDSLNIDTGKLGCIMLDLQPFDILKHVENGQADLYTTSEAHSGGAVAEHEAHVTLLYGLLQNGNEIKEQVDKVLSGWKADSVVLQDVTSFPMPADAPSVPIVANVQTWDNDILEAHERLALLPHVNTFGRYNPHVTLAYVKNDPSIVQKWVKALNQVIPGMRLAATGINYGDLPEKDEEDDAGNGGKFLSDTPQRRELTEAEQNVNFDAISAFLTKTEDDFEIAGTKELTSYLEHVADNPDAAVQLPASYVKLLSSTYKTAYNYGKLSAANEQGLPAPSTPEEQREHTRRYVDLVTTMQTNDIEVIVKEAKAKLPLQLDDEEDTTNSLLRTLILSAAVAWVLQAILGTKGTVASQALNDGRNDAFDRFAQQYESVRQWSSVLETDTCSTCRALDGKTLTEEQYRTTTHHPQKHIRCKCLWVQILKMSKEYQLPEATGIDDAFMGELETLRATPKQQLIDSGLLQNGATKAEVESLMMYQGIYYREINNHFRIGTAISDEALRAAARIDKLITRNVTGSPLELYRGLGLKQQLSVGDLLDDAAFMSTSRSEMIARSFALTSDNEYKYVFRLTAPKDYNALRVNSILPESSLAHEKEILFGRGQNYIIKSMGKPDDNGIIDVDIALVDSAGKELADTQVTHVITPEELDAEDAALGEPTPEELAKIHEKMRGSDRGIKVTRTDGTTFTT